MRTGWVSATPMPVKTAIKAININIQNLIQPSAFQNSTYKMKSQVIKKIIDGLPDSPGIYKFVTGKGTASKILYIGKATSLRDRVKSYFNKDILNARGPLISKMLENFDHIDFIKTDSVLEALVLEAHLIKKFQPEANIKDKDNKSFNFVIITKEDFPRVLVVRGRELQNSYFSNSSQRGPLWKYTKGSPLCMQDISYSFGPFPNGTQLKEAMKIVRKMFPFRDKCIPFNTTNTKGSPLGTAKPCFNRQIGLCPGVCTGEMTAEEYAEQIKNIILFFEGDKKKLVKNLEKQMACFAKNHQFEKANLAKRTLFTLNHIQDISLIKNDTSRSNLEVSFRIESYDVAHMSGQNVVGVMTVVEDGEIKKSDYRKFKIKWFDKLTTSDLSRVNDTKALSEIISRRLAHIEWPMPNLVVVDGGVAQRNAVEKILKENMIFIPVVSVVKDEQHKPRKILGEKKWLKYEKEILLSNAEAHRFGITYHRKLRGKMN
ncbi:MAG: hypothetical protein WAX37_02580 [Minisyncoccia bacterium]